MQGMSTLGSTNVIGRNLRVLEALGGAFRVTLNEVSDRAGLAKSTTHRILSSLVLAGLVARDGRAGEYRLTGEFTRIGRTVDDWSLIIDTVAERAREMTLRRSWPLAVSVLDHGRMFVIYGTRDLTTRTLKPSTLYERLELTTAMGQAALASLLRAQQTRVLDTVPEFARGTPARRDIEEKIRLAKKRGYGLRMTGRAGTSSVAVDLNFGGRSVCALASTVFTKVATLDLMRSLAKDLQDIRRHAETAYNECRPALPLRR
jgi:DNA-binding IclR family transcriptional regulator